MSKRIESASSKLIPQKPPVKVEIINNSGFPLSITRKETPDGLSIIGDFIIPNEET